MTGVMDCESDRLSACTVLCLEEECAQPGKFLCGTEYVGCGVFSRAVLGEGVLATAT